MCALVLGAVWVVDRSFVTEPAVQAEPLQAAPEPSIASTRIAEPVSRPASAVQTVTDAQTRQWRELFAGQPGLRALQVKAGESLRPIWTLARAMPEQGGFWVAQRLGEVCEFSSQLSQRPEIRNAAQGPHQQQLQQRSEMAHSRLQASCNQMLDSEFGKPVLKPFLTELLKDGAAQKDPYLAAANPKVHLIDLSVEEQRKVIKNILDFPSESSVFRLFQLSVQGQWFEGQRYPYRKDESTFSGSSAEISVAEDFVPCILENRCQDRDSLRWAMRCAMHTDYCGDDPLEAILARELAGRGVPNPEQAALSVLNLSQRIAQAIASKDVEKFVRPTPAP
ncbi:MAG: hypothetical protein ACOVRJ_20770 [Roseateles sp.]